MSWIKNRREQLSLTQDELAARLQLEGVEASRSAVSAWETGRNKLQFDDPVIRLGFARVLRFSESELMKLEGYPTEPSSYSEQAERAAYIVDQLPDERRDLALKLLEQLL